MIATMEPERRAQPRSPRRLWVLVAGETGFTADVTANGFCVEGVRIAQPGTSLAGSIAMGDREFAFVGTVCWTRAADAQHVRMGIRFLEVPDEFREAFAARGSAG